MYPTHQYISDHHFVVRDQQAPNVQNHVPMTYPASLPT